MGGRWWVGTTWFAIHDSICGAWVSPCPEQRQWEERGAHTRVAGTLGARARGAEARTRRVRAPERARARESSKEGRGGARPGESESERELDRGERRGVGPPGGGRRRTSDRVHAFAGAGWWGGGASGMRCWRARRRGDARPPRPPRWRGDERCSRTQGGTVLECDLHLSK